MNSVIRKYASKVYVDDDLDGLMSGCIVLDIFRKSHCLESKDNKLIICPAEGLSWDIPSNPLVDIEEPHDCKIRQPIHMFEKCLALDIRPPKGSFIRDAIFVHHHKGDYKGYVEVYERDKLLLTLNTQTCVCSTVETLFRQFRIQANHYKQPAQKAYYADCARDEGIACEDPIFIGYHIWRKDPLIKREFLKIAWEEGCNRAMSYLEHISQRMIRYAKEYVEYCDKKPTEKLIILKHDNLIGVATGYYTSTLIIDLDGHRYCITPCEYVKLFKLHEVEYHVLIRYWLVEQRLRGIVIIRGLDINFRRLKTSLSEYGVSIGSKISSTASIARFGITTSKTKPQKLLKVMLDAIAKSMEHH